MRNQTVVIRYNAGNIRSVLLALERLGATAVVTDDPDAIRAADRVLFPGVGEASSAMRYLRDRGLDEVIRSLRQPFLGICLGMQLMCRHSEENDTECLGIFEEDVRRFDPAGLPLKVPQMGWNGITSLQGPLFRGIGEDTHVYFVHSYHATLGPDTRAVTEHIVPFSAALGRDNFHGVQFHPEKSATAGEAILRNFLEL
ncbi:MAG: imidazole glycerol phosphate synthase subunit HisH [Chitinophagia bacterium]|nr:imidazole glycerol phosphate synthase subunit HisH [Chitinophagia bacterium]